MSVAIPNKQKVPNTLITPSLISQAFHIGYETIRTWSELEQPLVFEEIQHTSQTNQVHTYQQLTPSCFWSWAKNHLDIAYFKRYESDILPDEPYWVNKVMRSNKLKNTLLPPNTPWSDQEDKTLVERYYQEHKNYKEVAELLERTPDSIRGRLQELRKEKSPLIVPYLKAHKMVPFYERIDDETLDYIKEKYGKLSIEVIAKKVKVSPRMIEKVAIHHGFSDMRVNQGYITPNAIAKAFNVCQKTVIQWSKSPKYNGLLPLMELPNSSKSQKVYTMLGIEPEKVWNWVHNNLDFVDLRKYTPLSLNPEPVWLQNALKEQRRTLPEYRPSRLWNEFEDSEVWHLYYTVGLSQKEIAIRMNKTQCSVEKRLKRLREKKLKKNGNTVIETEVLANEA